MAGEFNSADPLQPYQDPHGRRRPLQPSLLPRRDPRSDMKPVSVVVVGAGSRGSGYASFAANNPSLTRVVGVAEPRAAARQRLVQEHGLPSTHVFTDWRDLADAQRLADVAIVATQDHMHVEPTVALAERGYHILLEKPMAPDEAGCRKIDRVRTCQRRVPRRRSRPPLYPVHESPQGGSGGGPHRRDRQHPAP